MGIHFFEKQCHDGHEASHLAVRLQKILCGIIFLYILWSILGFIFLAYAAITPIFWFGFIGFGILFVGFYGSYRRQLGMLTAYIWCAVIAVAFYGMVVILYGINANRIADCAANNCLGNDPTLTGELRAALVLYVIELIIAFLIFVLLIASVRVAARLRRHLREALHHNAHHHHGHVEYSGASVPIYQNQQPVYQNQSVPNVPPPQYTQTYVQPPPQYQQQPYQGYQQYQQQPSVVPLDPNNGYNKV